MKLLDISEVARQSGVPASALRHYEDKGLIHSAGRRGLKRLFGPEVLDQLSIIRLGKQAGFSLEEIKGMFGPDGRPSIPRAVLLDKANDLDGQIARLTSLRDMIRHVADCSAPRHIDCPRFQKLIRVSARKGVPVPNKF
jgi:MerR family redox-sensitive transcriptional activator SoxR